MRKSIKKTIAILCTIAILIGMLTLAAFASEGWPPDPMPPGYFCGTVNVTVRVYRNGALVQINDDPAAQSPYIMVWYRAAEAAVRTPNLVEVTPGDYTIPPFSIPGLQVGDRVYMTTFFYYFLVGIDNPELWTDPLDEVQVLYWNVYSLLTADDVLFREARDQSRWFYFLGADARPLVEPLPDLSLGHHGVAHAPDSIEFIPATADTLDKFILEISKCADRVAVDFSQLIGDALAGDVSVNGLTIYPPVGGNPDHVIHIYDGGWDSFARSAYVMVGAPPQGEYREVTLTVEVGGNVVGQFIVRIYRAEPFNEGGVLFREQRAPSLWFYHIGAPARALVGDPDLSLGHHGNAADAAANTDFVACPIPTFTLYVSKCASQVAVDIAGLIDPAAFVLYAGWLDIGTTTNLTGAVNVYTTPDAGWGAGHIPAYLVVGAPAPGESRTLVMEVDGVLFHVVINRAAPFNEGGVLFREQRDPSLWFYYIGAIARDPDVYTDTHGHFGPSPAGAITFVDCPIPTFTLNVTECATEVAIDIAGLIEDRDNFELLANWLGVALLDLTAAVNLYTTIDAGWGADHMPAYLVVGTPAPGESRTLVMVVDGVEFHVVINRAPIGTLTLAPNPVNVNDTNLVVTSTVTGGTGPIVITNNNLPPAVTVVVNQETGEITLTGVRPATGQPAVTGTFTLTVNRGCIYEILTVNVNLTPLPPQQPGFVGGGVVTPPTIVEYDDEEVPLAPFSPYHHAYLIGYTDGTIRPNANITRAEVATIFFRLLCDEYRVEIWNQTNPFPDVVLQDWFNNAISTLAGQDYLLGYPDGYFRPNQAMTRAEFSALLVRMVNGENNGEAGDTPFTDIAGHWAEDYIYAAYALGWVQGFGDGTFRPDRQITRAEVAALVNRALNRLPEYPSDLLEDMVTWPDNMNQNAWYYLYIQEATNSHEHEMKECGTRETWVELLTPREWWRLERPDSDPTIFTGYYIGEEIGVGE